ncbi:hypothetical protein HNR30_003541 [Nonomuraea soli]|uniref:Uncharacterized protein n=1 Tax=Nonomuraea soli TaxID=1032476 RepID=A0A7W0CJB6_9ACTN|nr:hypothetical protein [Nonomuraea soli]
MQAVTDVITALLPPTVVAAVFIYGVVKLVKSEAAGRRSNASEGPENQN